MTERTDADVNEEVKNNQKEPEASVERTEENNNENANNAMSIYRKILTRLCWVSAEMMIFAISVLRATKISGFGTTKLLLFELCLLVLLAFVIGAVISLVKMRHDSKDGKGDQMVAAHIYVSALSAMVVLLLVWVFFKANSM